MSSLAQPMIAADEQGERADDMTTVCASRWRRRSARTGRSGRPGGHHGRGVDQRGDRGRAFHRVGQPGLQRELAGLAARAEQQQQPDRGDGAAGQLADAVEDAREVTVPSWRTSGRSRWRGRRRRPGS